MTFLPIIAAMDILFKSKNLERLCHDDTLATRTFGRLGAQKLRARLDDLQALVNLAQAPHLPGRFRAVDGHTDTFALNLHAGHQLVIQPAMLSRPKRTGDSLNLSAVTVICVMRIDPGHV